MSGIAEFRCSDSFELGWDWPGGSFRSLSCLPSRTKKVLTELMNAALASLSSEQLRRAVAIKEQIEALEKELNRLLSGAPAAPAEATPAPASPTRAVRGRRGGRQRLSPEARARLAEAARRRWALRKGVAVAAATSPEAGAAEAPAATSATRPRRRSISPEGKRRIIEAQKRRWAAWRAARKAKAQNK